MKQDFIIEDIGGRKLCLKGVGQLFYESGFPIEMSVLTLREKGIDVSFLHVADELYKNGWKKKSIISAFSTGDGYLCDIEPIIKFIDAANIWNDGDVDDRPTIPGREYIYSPSGYERQRAIIFEYLFDSDREKAKEFILKQVA